MVEKCTSGGYEGYGTQGMGFHSILLIPTEFLASKFCGNVGLMEF